MAGVGDFTVAPIPLAATRVVIGTSIGTRFAGFDKRLIARTASASAFTMAMLTLVAAIFAYLVSKVSGTPFAVLLRAYSPGGLLK